MINNEHLWNTLKSSEEFKSEIGGDFEFVSVFFSGRTSYSFKIKSPEGYFVIKTPLNISPIYKNWWRIASKKEYSILNKLDREKTNEYVNIPTVKLLKVDDYDIAINSFISGEILTKEMFLALDSKTQNQITKNLAYFLKYLHSLPPDDFWQYGMEDGKCMLNQVDNCSCIYRKSRTEFLKFFAPFFDEELKEFFDNEMQKFDNMKDIHSKIAFIHNDLRISNILYDFKNKKLGVIDFGEAFVASNVACEFANMAKANMFGFEFTNKVIDYYNEISDTKVSKSELITFAAIASLHDNRNIYKMASEKQEKDINSLRQFIKEVKEIQTQL